MKPQVRQKYIAIRREVDCKAQKSALIAERVLSLEEYKKASVMAVYKAMANEVSTEEIISSALSDGKTVALPKTEGENMSFYRISRDEKLIKSPFGVLEPEGTADKYIAPDQIDLLIMPGVAFDRRHNRLGYGKGYYDRYLQKCPAKTVAVCFQEQIAETGEITPDAFDVKPQKIITELEAL